MAAQPSPIEFVIHPDMTLCTQDVHPQCFASGTYRHVKVGTGHQDTIPVYYKPIYDHSTQVVSEEVLGQVQAGKIVKLSLSQVWDRMECVDSKNFIRSDGVFDSDMCTTMHLELWMKLTGLNLQDTAGNAAAPCKSIDPIIPPKWGGRVYYGDGMMGRIGALQRNEANVETESWFGENGKGATYGRGARANANAVHGAKK
ncbi:hypothetical protein LTR95_006382 [Oleoguttula sp. CCFEE 5521]